MPLLALLAGLAGCGHDEPFTQEDFGLDTTLTRGADRQLTYNFGEDRRPNWLNDGSGILYMFEDVSRTDRDRCMGELPATGGTIRHISCPATLPSLDSTDALYEASQGPDGRILYLREASQIDGITASNSALMLGDPGNPLDAVVLRPYPYTAADGKVHQGISNIRWLSPTSAIYLAEQVLYIGACSGCPIDTVRTGIELMKVDLSGPAATIQVVPNTDEVSSAWAGPDSDQVYITRNGDSRVFLLTLSTGDVAVVHDFGPPLIARDVSVRGSKLFAIVDGRVNYIIDPDIGPYQKDEGGQIREVDLTTGIATTRIVNGRFFRRPAVSPDGSQVVAEAMIAIITGCGFNCADTTLAKVADLWLFEAP